MDKLPSYGGKRVRILFAAAVRTVTGPQDLLDFDEHGGPPRSGSPIDFWGLRP